MRRLRIVQTSESMKSEGCFCFVVFFSLNRCQHLKDDDGAMPVGDLGGRVPPAGRRRHGAFFQRRRPLGVCAFEERKPGTYEMRDGPVGSGRGRRVTWRKSRYDWYNGSVCLSRRRSVACSFPSPWRLGEREREVERLLTIRLSLLGLLSAALSLSLSLLIPFLSLLSQTDSNPLWNRPSFLSPSQEL